MRSKVVKRPPFDPRYSFVASPPAGRSTLAVGGAQLEAGAKFDKTKVTPRRLRQMYEARLISVAPGHEPLPAQPRRHRRPIGSAAVVPPPPVEATAAIAPPERAESRVAPRRAQVRRAG